MYPQNQFDKIDALGILSFIIGYENLIENRQQSAHNDIQSANDQQARYLLEELKRLFQEQNEMLESISRRVDRLEAILYRMIET